MLNKVSSNASEITYTDNLYNFKSAESTSGFTRSSITFEQITSGTGKGLYVESGKQLPDLPEAAIPQACGTPWYATQQTEMNAIATKTIFQDGNSNISTRKQEADIKIAKKTKTSFQVDSNEIIESVSVMSIQGQILSIQPIQNNTGSIYLPSAAGTYILSFQMTSGSILSRKLQIR